MRNLLFMFICLLLGICMASAQTSDISGVVVSAEDGEPIIGASVIAKGTTQGTITDMDGHFKLKVAKSIKHLVVSYVGMQTKEVAVKPNLRIVMEPATEQLDEVMVVAYGTTKKSSFTGAASQVSGEKLQKLQVSNITKGLEGTMSGVQTTVGSGTPGASSSIIIRGLGSISASQNPLIVVDGVPYEGSLNSISPQDIESLTVLKDAAANSMYGARGSNGVIIITTKGGRAGKTQVNFEGRFGFNSRGIPIYDIIQAPGPYYEMMYESIRNSLMKPTGTLGYMDASIQAANTLISKYLKYNVYKDIADTDLINPYTGKLNSNAQALKWHDNWADDPFDNGTRQEYNLNVSGGTDKTTAYLSIGYLSDEGYVVNSSFDRISTRLKVQHNIGDYVRIGGNIAYSYTDQNQFGDTNSNYSNIFMFSQMIGPIYPIYLYDAEGKKMFDNKNRPLYDFGTEYKRPYASESNPYAVALENKNKYITDNVSSRGFIEFRFLKDFRLTANVAYDVFNQYNSTYDTPIGGDAKKVGGRAERESYRIGALNANQLLNWQRDFDKHHVNALIGHETKHNKTKTLYGHMTGFVDSDNSDFANATLYQDLTSSSDEYSIEGYFIKAEYDYDDKYYFTGSFRRDGSSVFDPSVRWGSFWAIGASWRISQEPFMAPYTHIVDNLKLKASYGTQGNDNILYNRAYLDLYKINRVDGEAAMEKKFRGNPNLTWEKSKNFNVGFEASLLERLTINADFFIKKTEDMLYRSPLPTSEGNPTWIFKNEMDMKNTGFEFEVSADLIKQENLKWNLSFNGTTYKNKLTRLPSSKDPSGYAAGIYWRKKGGSLYDWYTYEYAGVDKETGLPLYNKYTTDEDGKEVVTQVNKTSNATRREIGKSAIPDLIGGISTTLSAYGFDLSIQTAYQVGGYVFDSFYQGLMNPGDSGGNMHIDMFNRWTPAHTNTHVPALIYSDQEANAQSDRWLTKASYFGLKNVTLGYTLPTKWIKKIQIDKLRVYLTGDNIWLATKRKGLDPRQNFTGETGFVYSALSSYSIGVNMSF